MKLIDLVGLSEFLKKCKEIFADKKDSVFEAGTGTNSVQQKGTGAEAISEGSVAIGIATHSGTKGFRWASYDKASLTFTLEKALPKAISNNAWLSIINDSHYDKCCQVDGNISVGSTTIKVKTSPFDSKVEGDTGYDAYTMMVVDDPTIGDIDLGQTAHAEGGNTNALQMFSHAEGYGTEALGQYSHAEGRENKAVYAAHAEGRNTEAIGNYSHTEGRGTIAEGLVSHAEGAETKTIGSASHSEGKDTIANGYVSHAEGAGSITGGDYTSNTLTPYSAADGGFAHAEGNVTIAKAKSSHSEGQKTFASGIASHSEGQETVAQGNNSHAEGYKTTSTGRYSHAEGQLTNAVSDDSHAEGMRTVADGNHSHAEGSTTKAFGVAAHSEGVRTKTNGDGAHAEGYETWAGIYEGDDGGDISVISAPYSHTEGQFTFARGRAAHAEGIGINTFYPELRTSGAFGIASHSEGVRTLANAQAAHSEGQETKAKGTYSHAEGYNTQATKQCAHAEGAETEASGQYSHTEGYKTIATNDEEHAEGKYNVSNTGTISSIGIGTSSQRKNAFEVMQNGDAYLIGVGGYDGTNAATSGVSTLQNSLGGNSVLQITGTYDVNDNEFTCTSGQSLTNVKDALLAGKVVIVDVTVVDLDNMRYITSDLSVAYDAGSWYAYSRTFANGTIDSWVVAQNP